MLLNLDPTRKITITNEHPAFASTPDVANEPFAVAAKPLTRPALASIAAATADNLIERTKQIFMKSVTGWSGFQIPSPGGPVDLEFSEATKEAMVNNAVHFTTMVVNAISAESNKVEASQADAAKN